MKKLIYLLFFLNPLVVLAQLDGYKSSPFDYMWMNVGNAGFSAGQVADLCLALNSSGQPYVAYRDAASGKATVMKFDGTNWVNVGTAGFSAGGVENTSLAFNLSGQPNGAYVDYVNNRKSTVMKYNGTLWENVGNEGFSLGKVEYTSLAVSPIDDQPYVAFADMAHAGRTTVMKFDGTNWVNVGTAGFSAGRVWSESLAFSPIGQPYVAYNDGVNSYKATVMKYDFPNGNIEPRQSLPSLYPNPASNELTIESLPIPALSQLTISNIDGQQLITRQITQPKIQLDISSLPSGMYIVRLTGDKTVSTSKFIKQ